MPKHSSRAQAHGAIRQQYDASAGAVAACRARGARRPGAQARRRSGDGESLAAGRPGPTSCKPCRGPRAAPPTLSSPNTICRAKPLRRTTCAPMRRAMSGIRISSRIFSASSIRRPARTGIRHTGTNPARPTGALDLEADSDGNLWLAMMFQTGVAKFDMTTKTFQMFPVQAALDNAAAQQSMVMPGSERRRQGVEQRGCQASRSCGLI